MNLGRVGIWSSSAEWGPDSAATAAGLEAMGFESLWLGNAPADLRLVERLLGATSSLVVATAIISVFTNEAADLAGSYRRVAEQYPNRLLIGIGVSHRQVVTAAGSAYERPLDRLSVFLDQLDEFGLPVAHRIVGANGPKALSLAAERSAGAHPYLVTPDYTAAARAIMGEEKLLAPEQMVILEADEAVARGIAREKLSHYLKYKNYRNNLARQGYLEDDFENAGSDQLIDALFAWGKPNAIAERINEHFNAGADNVSLQVLQRSSTNTTLPLRQWHELAGELL